MISKENYQSYLLDRIEGVLSEKDNTELDKFLEQNPELIPLEDEYDNNIKIDDNYGVVYPNFDNLIRSERKLMPIIIKYTSIAAMITLLITVTILFFNNGKEKQQSIPIAKTILKDINENTNIELVEPSTIKREKTIINKSSNPIAKNKEKIEKVEENTLINAETKSELIAIQTSDTIKLVANNLIEYVEVFVPKPKIDTIYIYTNWLCRYEKTPTKQPYQRIQNSIRGFLANK